MEFGRTPGQIRNVLAVLSDGGDSVGRVLAAAVELAEAEHARLTLAKTCPGGRAYVWVAPFAAGGAYVPPPVESPEEACRILVRAAEEIPGCIPVTMRVLGCDTQRALVKLLRDGDFGAVVGDRALFSCCRRLRRQLRRDQIMTVQVGPRPERDVADLYDTTPLATPYNPTAGFGIAGLTPLAQDLKAG